MDWTKTGVTVAAGLWVAGPAGLWWTVTVDLRVAELWMTGLVDLRVAAPTDLRIIVVTGLRLVV